MNTLNDFLASIKEVKFFSGAGELPDGCVLFDTREAAWNATWNVTWNATRDAAKGAAMDAARDAAVLASAGGTWDAAWNDTWKAAWRSAWKSAWDADGAVAWDAARDAALVATCITTWDDHSETNTVYALKRWSVWTAGFGLRCEAHGMLYCYRSGK